MDAVMRDRLTSVGGYDRCVTEFVRVSQTVLPSRVFWRLCPELRNGGVTPSGVPVYVQLLGSDPELMASNAKVAARLGAPGIDLNFGCPAKTVNKSQGGAALLRTPHVIGRVCQAVRDAVPPEIPVTAKVRLGFDNDESFEQIVDAATGTGISELVVHARTRRQGYRPPAHWSRLADANQRSPVAVIANGELWSPADVLRCREDSGCEAFMLARGALCRPDLALAVRHAVEGTPHQPLQWSDVLPMLLDFLDYNARTYALRYALNPVKQWLMYLMYYYPEAAELFPRAKRLTTVSEMTQVLMQYDAHRTALNTARSAA